ncbi:tellurium resistance protein [Actibacterium ureilyticum]|uniref:SLAC1 family transporter n=1 Tax=Actibacterium ureilyticum TaxID=1590614 RepID=UPI000BAAF5D9|nr:tellurium resistance protein [Actibacterium ureilyticum]
MDPFPIRPKFATRTPPAIFPPVFGLFGLGLAWRRAGDTFQMPAALGEMILGAVTLLFVFCALAYGIKVARRPAVIAEDLRVLPGRAGLAAAVLCTYLLAGVLARMDAGAARLVLWLGLGLNAGLIGLYLWQLVTGPAEQRVVTPVWHLIFVGPIVGAMVAAQLGAGALAQGIFWVTLPVAFGIWAASLVQLWRTRFPAPLRPFLAIHLAPACLLGIVALMLGRVGLAVLLGYGAIAILAALVLAGRWLTAGGFGPAWSSFTFPLAAFATLMQLLASAGQGAGFRLAGGLALVAATLIVPVIAFKVMQIWAKGQLGAKTNAASA